MERKYKVKEITPKENMCMYSACPAIYEVEELTPNEEKCGIGACPGIYEVKEITPKENMCLQSACPGIYEVEELTPKDSKCVAYTCPAIYEDQSDNYLIVGEKANPSDFVGLEGKVGKDEVLIKIPKEIIDNRRG